MGVNKDIFWVWNRIRNWTTGRHTPTKNSQASTPPVSHYIRISNTVLDSGFQSAVGSGIQVLDSGFFLCGIWIPDFKLKRDSGSQGLVFRIPQAKLSWIPESGFP